MSADMATEQDDVLITATGAIPFSAGCGLSVFVAEKTGISAKDISSLQVTETCLSETFISSYAD